MKYNRLLVLVVVLSASHAASLSTAAPANRPNVVFVVADDMGWRDTSFQGSPHAKTPHLDDMAAQGVRFDYFYPGQQMCSPGRFALLTGRTPFRTGLHHLGAMRPQEITVAKALKTVGYHTAHFGKWHLGGKGTKTSPVRMGFDKAIWKLNYFDLGDSLDVGNTKEAIALEGDTSVATMRLARDFIREHSADRQPFFVQVCFGSPHSPHRAADEFKAMYAHRPEKEREFLGELSGVDAAVGELRAELRKLGIADNTLVWFTSDNGGITPNSQDPAGKGKTHVGVRTVSVLEWPARVKAPIRTSVPAAHMDMYPTILDITGVTMPQQPVLDGISLVPLLNGRMTERSKPLGFLLWNGKLNQEKFDDIDFVSDTQGVLIDGQYKLIVPPQRADSTQKDRSIRLHDIFADPAEKTNLAAEHPDIVQRLRATLENWQRSVQASYDGQDFAKTNDSNQNRSE